jgi:hypothetical protein
MTIDIHHLEELAFNFILEARASVGKDFRGLDGIDYDERDQVADLAEKLAKAVSGAIEKKSVRVTDFRYTVRNGVDNGGSWKSGLTLEEAIQYALEGKRYHRIIWRESDDGDDLAILRVTSSRWSGSSRLAIVRRHPQWKRPLTVLEARYLTDGLGRTYK